MAENKLSLKQRKVLIGIMAENISRMINLMEMLEIEDRVLRQDLHNVHSKVHDYFITEHNGDENE